MSHRVPSLKRYHAGWHRAARYVAQRMVLRPVVRTVTRTTVEGLDNLDGLDEAYVVVANHCSHLDTAVLVTSLPKTVTKHLAVGAAADYFFSRWYMKAATSLFFNTYPIHRTSGGKRTGKGLSQRLLGEGVPLLIFPEGTRSRDGAMKRFKPGAATLCVAKSVPCVPVALLGTYEAMPVGRNWPVPGRPRVRMLVGRPMRPRPGEKARDFNDRVAARVETMLAMQTPYVLGDTRPGREVGDNQQEEAS
ncbi:lysophospholipid acyltransferase family protein [Georgenia subflava]|uniref:1-acyl-sn-glycerol-3-phosphate acyltransferase n=1 Tax=Georgenia subflava TaxID=1622177 RepID=A0A6N7EQB7_9MICO|nr:lysophospholipid acyltransferase family protein [Georgenia subflava]MPV38705.1 1-acyl-sn-glycerol-3-phosphate acyltransferase [Georgenia subflava]